MLFDILVTTLYNIFKFMIILFRSCIAGHGRLLLNAAWITCAFKLANFLLELKDCTSENIHFIYIPLNDDELKVAHSLT